MMMTMIINVYHRHSQPPVWSDWASFQRPFYNFFTKEAQISADLSGFLNIIVILCKCLLLFGKHLWKIRPLFITTSGHTDSHHHHHHHQQQRLLLLLLCSLQSWLFRQKILIFTPSISNVVSQRSDADTCKGIQNFSRFKCLLTST